MLHLQHHLLRQHLRVAEDRAEVGHPAARHSRAVQSVDPVVDRVFADARADQRVDRVPVPEALLRVTQGALLWMVQLMEPLPVLRMLRI